MKYLAKTLTLAACLIGVTSVQSKADSQPFLGTIMQVGTTFCPRGWAEANGQLLPISQYSAVFALLGTMYGGDGRTTFGLPDLRGRFGMGVGNGPGLTPNRQGERIGLTEVTHSVLNMPTHSHTLLGTVSATVAASSNSPDNKSPANAFKPTFPAGALVYAETGNLDLVMGEGSVQFIHAASVSNTGGQQPVSNMQPYLAMKTCVALEGIFPSRS
ncbi:phage tail protein [Roseovarius aestuariivivens]|uniref:phage tail protein n=1 Tax=Roseovarius aestuariivivens TaxID=1888910 RepID=UPI0010813C7A|nr:tail fiber protein [Roseovarius aestuariivivens]